MFHRFLLTFALFSSLVFFNLGFAQTNKNKIEEIAIVSLLGDFALGNKVPAMFPFKKEKFWVAYVPDWGVDNLVHSTAQTFVENNSGFSANVLFTNPIFENCLDNNEISADCRNIIFSKAKEQGFKYLLLVEPMSDYSDSAYYTNYGGTVGNIVMGGYGYYRESGIRCVYALFSVGIYDVETGKSFGRAKDNNKLKIFKSGFPCYSKHYRDKKTEAKIPWKDDFNEYSDQEKDLMRSYIFRGIEKDVLELLPELKLFKE